MIKIEEIKKYNESVNMKCKSKSKRIDLCINLRNLNLKSVKIYVEIELNCYNFSYDLISNDFLYITKNFLKSTFKNEEIEEIKNIATIFWYSCLSFSQNLSDIEITYKNIEEYAIILDNNKNIFSIKLSSQEALELLNKMLLNKYIAKIPEIKNVQYNYNYNDLQKITFIKNNDYRIEFFNIKTKQGIF